MAMEITFGSFLCKLHVAEVACLVPCQVQTTRTVYKEVTRKVPKQVEQVIKVGCTERCEGLKAYTKSSFRKAIKEGDLTQAGRCYLCGFMAQVGQEAKPHEMKIVTTQYVDDVETIAVTEPYTYVDYVQTTQLAYIPELALYPTFVNAIEEKLQDELVEGRVTKPTEVNNEATNQTGLGNWIEQRGNSSKQFNSVRTIKWPLNKTPRIKSRKPSVRQVFKGKQEQQFMQELLETAANKSIPVEVILERNSKLSFAYEKATEQSKALSLRIKLAHASRKFANREVNPRFLIFIKHLIYRVPHCKSKLKTNATFGDSGLVNLVSNDAFIIRGRDKVTGNLIDASDWIPQKKKSTMEQYSIPNKFWEGFNRKFLELRPEETHTCQSNFPVELCGEAAAIFYQILHPCRKITCAACSKTIESYSNAEIRELQQVILAKHQDSVNTLSNTLTGFGSALSRVRNMSVQNPNLKACMEVQRLTQNVKKDQMHSLQVINEALIKSSYATEEEISLASEHLCKITQWFSNHLSTIAGASLQAFRNKISGKAALNPSLLCDNQLDKNGNFIWGERGYHSKRFFSNFFEEVTPGDGYERYKIRRNPNGTRKLAIGNLIVSTNFERARDSLRGEVIERQPLTEACVSRQDGSFVHICCCVTTDDGKPRYSEMKNPTKRHLVIGTTGDSKYVDLPDTDSGKMYIAKEGYCYMNIFLAMLLNVNESEAKNFTKMVRDVLVPNLGQWPTMMDVATACYILTVFHPEVRNAELPRILVDHTNQIFHVIDSYGSLTTGFHILKAGTVNQLVSFSSSELTGEMKHYRVGGEEPPRERMIKRLIKCVYKKEDLKALICEDPYVLLLSLLSPSLILALANSGSLEYATVYWLHRDQSLSMTLASLHALSKKLSLSKSLMMQQHMIESHAHGIHHYIEFDSVSAGSKWEVSQMLQQIMQNKEVDKELTDVGFISFHSQYQEIMEKKYASLLEEQWRELNWLEKSSVITRGFFARRSFSNHSIKQSIEDSHDRLSELAHTSHGKLKTLLSGASTSIKVKLSTFFYASINCIFKRVFSLCAHYYSDFLNFVNAVVVVSVLLTIFSTIQSIAFRYRKSRAFMAEHEEYAKFRRCEDSYQLLVYKLGTEPTYEEFVQFLEEHDKESFEYVNQRCGNSSEVVHQVKTSYERNLEKTVGCFALLAMIFDPIRSDAIFRILSKLKTLFTVVNTDVIHQSVDEIQSTEADKKETIDFLLDQEGAQPRMILDAHFEKWWSNQLEQNRVVPHYRTGGYFIEFTRATSALVASQISHSENSEFLIRGAVGSGKSTSLPNELSKRGSVLLVEPTRPLAENVCKQLRQEPFNLQPTLRMRGANSFGSSNITVMTNGFALHHYAHNPSKLLEVDFIIFDECHVLDSAGMAFFCLLKEYAFKGKILKVSATPPGKECEFTPQYNVQVVTSDAVSFQTFVQEQGTSSNLDALKFGNNILVYVASYNDVDQLSKMLLARNFQVTKIDGRTMKVGQVEIRTKGSTNHPHYLVATNIIENGVTLDVEVVVDFGLKVVADIDLEARSMRYTKQPVSYGERLQRIGRVGRVKPGAAIRIGETQVDIQEIPVALATEAAFYCFAYGLPVMVHNVTTSLVSKCTSTQAKAMLQFELPIFVTFELISVFGSIHPAIYEVLKRFKLRDSDTVLHVEAIPNRNICKWHSVETYKRFGIRIPLEEYVRIPFYDHSVPEKMYEDIWNVTDKHRHEAGFGRLHSVSACKVAHTLKIDPTSIQRTLGHIEHLIAEEMTKKSYFDSLNSATGHSSYSLNAFVNCIRRKCLVDHSRTNIEILQKAKAQILEFNGREYSNYKIEDVLEYGYLETVLHQSSQGVAQSLKLQGKWNLPEIGSDLFIASFILVGGLVLMWHYFGNYFNEEVHHQGNKRKLQKLKFRNARDKKVGREVYGDDDTIEAHFGSAYTKHGKKKGKGTTKNMGTKNRKFINMYGFDPTDYSYVRFLDPITGVTIDSSTIFDMQLIQEELQQHRVSFLEEHEDAGQLLLSSKNVVEAYFVNDAGLKALKVDLTPHNSLALSARNTSVAGFPEREFELRQTGEAKEIDISAVPKSNEVETTHESQTLHRGVRNYNPIAGAICLLSNSSDDHIQKTYGIGYGSCIITNGHLLSRNNGSLVVKSHQGEFLIKNLSQTKIHHVRERDLILIQMPKDFPVFPQKLIFRPPVKGENVCLVSTIFQTKSMTSAISESSPTYPKDGSTFWKHWISTKDGDCGLPLVSTRDGAIVGIHSLANIMGTVNFFVSFPEDFEKTKLRDPSLLDWSKQWVYNPSLVCWGAMNLKQSQPDGMFKISKLIQDLNVSPSEIVAQQSVSENWVFDKLEGNLKGVARASSNLVVKHTVKGQCKHFSKYLAQFPDKQVFFSKYLNVYAPSVLSKESFLKDFMKYSTPIVVGEVNCQVFEMTVDKVIAKFNKLGFEQCNYVTDTESIFQSLNLKAAVGALYSGKKRDYFENYTDEMKDAILYESCYRLYTGKMGIWNGSLKAELRPVEKVRLKKTRTFTSAPLDSLLGGKVCVDDFNNQFYDLHLKGPWTVGISKFFRGWDTLIRRLPDNWIYCDADGSRFDSSLSPYLLNAVLKIRQSFMEEWDVGIQMLSNFYTEVIYTPILAPDGTIVKKFKGNNSGQPSTVVDNSLMVVLATLYSLQVLQIDIDEYEKFFVFYVNGDDLLIAVEPAHEWILDQLSGIFSTLGLDYDFSSRHLDREGVYFMSHKAILKEGLYIPKLDEDRIVSILQWSRSTDPLCRAEAICAAMIEAWGYDELLHEIRLFYAWLTDTQEEFAMLKESGLAPYISEAALRNLYTCDTIKESEFLNYLLAYNEADEESVEDDCVIHQSSGDQIDAGESLQSSKNKTAEKLPETQPENKQMEVYKDRDVDAGSKGPPLSIVAKKYGKMRLPRVAGKEILDPKHLIGYIPEQADLSNTRASHEQFKNWFLAVQEEYEESEEGMRKIMNGLMVWCIENGTSPNLTGMWFMMEGDTQIEYPLKPIIDNAKPSFRQIMHHFSDAAEAYIEMRNSIKPYMPRYGSQRNLNDMSLARFAFDFYEVNSRTPNRAREAHFQMKAAALVNVKSRMFGLDGNVGTQEEDTERHIASDVNRNMHTFLGVRHS